MNNIFKRAALACIALVRPRVLWFGLAVVFVLVFLIQANTRQPQIAHADTSSTINFQARILNSAGNTVPDGYYNARFKLYDGGTDGGPAGTGQANAGSLLWSEEHKDENGGTAGQDYRLRVVNGYLTVNLGSRTAFGSINWDQELWLTIDIGGTTQTATPTYDGEMLGSIPAANSRLKLTAVPYAFRAGGLQASSGANEIKLNIATPTADVTYTLQSASAGSYDICTTATICTGYASSSGSGAYIQNSTSLQTTANFNIQSAANSSVGGIIQGASGQTADLFQLKDGSGVILASFDASGKLVFGPSGSQDTNLYRSAANVLKTDDTLEVATNLGVGATPSGTRFQITSATADALLKITDTSGTPTDVFTIADEGAVAFRNATDSTTAFQIQNAAGTNILNVDSTNSTLSVRGINSDATIGSELLTGNCSGTNWSGTGAGPYAHTSGSTASLTCTISGGVTSGATYQITYDTTGFNNTQGITPAIGGVTGKKTLDNVTAQTQVITTSSTASPTFAPDTSTSTGSITNISFKLVTTSNSVLRILDSAGATDLEMRSSTQTGNTFIGLNSGRANSTGNQNTAQGYYALQSNTTGYNNTAQGSYALQSNTTGYNNTAQGYYALQSNTTGRSNTALGSYALQANVTGFSNIAIGDSSLRSNTTGQSNTAIGLDSLYSNTVGILNTALGSSALRTNTSGTENTAIGYSALRLNDSGSYNTALGNYSLYDNTGGRNTALGYNSLRTNTSGSYNTALGYHAGYNDGGFATLSNLQEASAIGSYAQVQQSNSMVLGRTATGSNQTKIGIGTTAPTNLFSISPIYYNTGTASQSGTTVTGTGTTWTSSMVGMELIFADGTKRTITAFGSTTSLTVGTSGTVTEQAYRIHNPAFYVTDTGSVAMRSSTNSTTAFQIQNASSQTLFVADTSNQRIAIGPASIPANGVLTLGTDTTTASGGLYFGTDTTLYRSAGNTLKTNGGFLAGGNIRAQDGGAGQVRIGIVGPSSEAGIDFGSAGDTNLYRSAANTLKTDDDFLVGSNITLAAAGTITGTTLNGTTGINTGAGAGTQRIDSSGNLVNIGNVTTSGASTFSTTGANGFIFKPGTDNTSAFQVQNAGGTQLFNIDTTAPTTNLITNSNFETNTSGWSAMAGSTLTQDTTQYLYGSGSMKVDSASASDGVKYAYSLSSSTSYVFSFYVKSTSDYKRESLEIGRSDNGSTNTACSYGNTETVVSGWSRYYCKFTTGTVSGSPYVYVRHNNTALDFFVDGAQLEQTTNGEPAPYSFGKLTLNTQIASPVFIQPSQNSSSALQIQNSAGETLLNVSSSSFNLLDNSSFENGSVSPWTAIGGSTLSTQDWGLIGSKLLYISTPAINDGAKYPISLESNTTYLFSFYANNIYNVEIGYSEDGSTDLGCMSNPFNDTTGSTRHMCRFTTGTVSGSPYVYIKNKNSGTNTLYVDGVQLHKELPGNESNYYYNPGFEVYDPTGDFAGLGGSETITWSTAEANSPSYSLSVATTASANNGVYSLYGLESNKSYHVSFWAKLASGTFNTFQVGYHNGTGSYSNCLTAQTVSTGSWTRYNCTLTTGQIYNYAGYIYFRQSDATARTFYIDDLTINTQHETFLTTNPYTSSTRLTIGKPSSAGKYTLDVGGTLNVDGGIYLNGARLNSTHLTDAYDLAKLSATQTFTGSNLFQAAVDDPLAFRVLDSSSRNYFNANTFSNASTVGNTSGTVVIQGNGTSTAVAIQSAASGSVNIGTNAVSSKTINIGSVGTTTQGSTVNIANTSSTSSAQVVYVGSTATNTNNITYIQGGSNTTQAIQIVPNTAGGIMIGASAGTGTITLGRSTATNTINIGSGNGSSATQTINIGAGTSTTSGGKAINIGTGTPGSSTTNTIAIGTGGSTTGTVGVTIGSNANAAHTTEIRGGSGSNAIALTPQTTGAIIIGASTGTGNITVGSSSGTQSVLIGNGAGVSTVSIANGTTAGATVNIAGNNTATGVTDTVNIGTGNTAGTGNKVVNIGSGTPSGSGTNAITIGTLTNASTTTIRGGTGLGAVSIQAASGATIQMSTSAGINTSIGNATGTLTLTGSSSSTFVINGVTVDATEFNYLDGKDAALIDANDSLSSTFGTIDTGDTITGTTLNGTTGINTGAGAGTQRIDASGNLLNIGTIGASGNITQTGATTFSTGTGAVSLNGATSVTGSNTFSVGTGLSSLGGNLDVTGSTAFKKGTDFSTTGTTNDANFGEVSLVRLTGASTQTITGIANGRDGELLTIVNAAGQSATITNNDSGSVAANRIITGTGASVTLTAGGSITLVYDSGASLWRTIGNVAFSTGNFIQNTTSPQTADFNITGDGVIGDDLAVNGDSITTDDATFYLLNSNATTINAFGAATAINIGADGLVMQGGGSISLQAGGTNEAISILSSGTGGVNIGTNATNHTTTIGTTSGTSGVIINSGTGDIALSSQDDLSLTATDAVSISSGEFGSITIQGGDSANVTVASGVSALLSLQGGTNGINIGSNGTANTIQIGNTTGAVTQTINIGNNSTASSTSNVNIGSSIAGTTAIQGTTTVTNRTSGSADTLAISNSTSTGNILVAKDNTTAVFTIADGGATIYKNETNSSTAFQIQNAGGASLFTVDTSNNILTLGGNNSGEIQNWSTTNTISARQYHSSVTYNGYIYVIGGSSTEGGFTAQSTVYYAKVKADGSVDSWNSTTSLPAARYLHSSVVANGYVYAIGGTDGTAQSTVYYAKLNSDGTIGSWNTTNSLPAVRIGQFSAVANGYVYTVGGSNGASPQSTVYYAKLNADGTTGAWQTSANALPAVRHLFSGAVANGYIYALGGYDGSATNSTIYYARLNGDGTVGAWSTNSSNPITDTRTVHTTVIANGYIYVIGGKTTSGGASQSTVYYAPLAFDGSIGAWSTSAATFTTKSRHTSVVVNGYIYAIGGLSSGGSVLTSVNYTTTQRIKTSGALDLVGLSGENLADGETGSGGELTAGNTKIVGSLSVQGQASFAQSVAIAQELNVGGSVLLKNTVQNSSGNTDYLKVQNGGGTNLLNLNSANLIRNSNFEGGVTNVDNAVEYWAKKGSPTSIKLQSSQSYFGSQSMEVVTTTTTAEGAKYSLQLSPSTQYTFSFYARLSTGSISTLAAGRSDNGSSDTACTLSSNTLNTTWTRYTCTFTTGATISGSPYVYVTKGTDASVRTIYIDGVQLETASSATNFRNGDLTVDAQSIFRSTANSTATFQIQNAAGQNMMNMNSTDGVLSLSHSYLHLSGVPVPVSPTLSSQGTGGSLAANTYYYRVGSYDNAGLESVSISTTPGNVATTGSTSRNTISWTQVAGVDGYVVDRSTDGGVTWYRNYVGNVASIIDDGVTYSWTGSNYAAMGRINYSASVVLESGGAVNFDSSNNVYVNKNHSTDDLEIVNLLTNGGVNITGSDLQYTDNTSWENLFTINNTGNVLFRTETGNNSATAFQIQNSSGAQMFNVDTTNNILTLGGNNSGAISSWGSTTALGSGTLGIFGDPVVYNGYIYTVGGYTGSSTYSIPQYARLNSDGTVGSWTNTTTLPAGLILHQVVALNGYMYVIGGSLDGSTALSTVRYAKINSDGSLSSWTATTSLPAIRMNGGVTTANGYIYFVGGSDGTNSQDETYVAKPNADGTITSWATEDLLPAARFGNGVSAANGYLYSVGGGDGSTAYGATYYARLSATDGSIGAWSTDGDSLGTSRYAHGTVVANGYIYAIGGATGVNGATAYASVEYAQLNSNGSIGAWTTTTAMSEAREHAGAVVNNGYIYVPGGATGDLYTSGNYRSTVYYASTQRIRMGGSLDLTSYSNGSDTEGNGSGGSLTAGNTNIVGYLQVAESATIGKGLHVGQEFVAGGSALFRNSSNSATAFQIQTSAGGAVFTADTSNTRISIGGASGSLTGRTLEVGIVDVTTRIRIGGATNGVSFDDSGTGASGKLRLYGTARNDVAVTLSPEFEGAVLTGDGSSNTGTMTSDFCANNNTNIPNLNTGVCTGGAAIKHNYYSWTANATNDYDIWVNWQVPSDFSSWGTTPIQFYGWRSSSSDSVTLTVYNSAGTTCGTATAITNTTTWSATTYTSSGCNPSAGDILTFRVQLSVGVNGEYARMGEILLSYKSQF